MALGLGHEYWVHLIKHHYGDLESCIKFMQENKPENPKQWFELRPMVKIVKGQIITCTEYQCDLVEDANNESKSTRTL